MTLLQMIPRDWRVPLEDEIDQDVLRGLERFLADEWHRYTVFPQRDDIFAALSLTPRHAVRAVILGQDPYHGEGQAHGLAFSVKPGVILPPSLRNIYKELTDDLGHPPATNGCLSHWAKQGVLLLNTVLTVRKGEANSHRKRGWEHVTDAIIRLVDRSPGRVVFVLWGASAQKKASLIANPAHAVITSPHPSPLSAARGFFGSQPFSRVNEALAETGQAPVDWAMPKPSLNDLPLFQAAHLQ